MVETPSLEEVSLTSASSLSIFKALVFPLAANALTLSQPVKAYAPIIPLHLSSPRAVVIFFMSISLVRVLEPWLCSLFYRMKVLKQEHLCLL